MTEKQPYDKPVFWAEKLWYHLRRFALVSQASRYANGELAAVAMEAGEIQHKIQHLRKDHDIPWHKVARFCVTVEIAIQRTIHDEMIEPGEATLEAFDPEHLRREWTEAERDFCMSLLAED